ncbi:DUF3019 domain-containing protein [Permianibacter sp. IMCC34836]|uniref:DUF3019 domain-containing protein n=1 Tax=Permianibacter fluminis TaxID=2738515 RepID=UPI00155814F3|nr:DUF3019 domain-containing protein [Permianibacter fluminis]NQD35484.1 DUF3019 domain-containing protein [Permianibacter fluminis]
MRHPHRPRRTALPLLLAGLCAPALQAQTINTALEHSLSIDPALCVLTSEQEQCTTPLRVRWQLPLTESTTLCLYIADQVQPLFCDNSAGAGEHRLQLALSHNTEFELRRQNDLNVLARATVTIARQLSDLRPRRRHGWGIF